MYLSPCGMDCTGCPLKEQCGGTCHELKGAPFYVKDFGLEVCPIYECAVTKKGYTTCGECAEMPCQIFYDWKDPEMSEQEHLQSVRDRVETLKA